MVCKRIVGVSPWSNPDYNLMKKAGIEWVRIGFDFPFVDKIGGSINPKFAETLKQVRTLRSQGIHIVGITTLAGILAFDAQTKKEKVWRSNIPAWAGAINQASYYTVYEKACEYMAVQTIGIVDVWQVSNEMDISEFCGPLSPEQAIRYMVAGGNGVKKGNPSAMAGINPAGLNTQYGRYFFEKVYSIKHSPFDYAGIDGYFGSWSPGGVETWITWIDEINKITGRPVLVNEWGYSSLGGAPAKPFKKPVFNAVCKAGAWFNVWKKEHSPEEQADFIATGLKLFATYPNCIGCLMYNWGDDKKCWHCGKTGCPAECGWGLVDCTGKPKPAYYAVKDTVKKYY